MRIGSDPGTGGGGLGVPGGALADPAQPLIAGLTFGRAAQVTGAHLNSRTDPLLSEDTRGPIRPRLSGFSLWPPKPRDSGLRPLLPSGGHSAEARDSSSPPLGPSPSRWLLVPPHPSPPRAPPPPSGWLSAPPPAGGSGARLRKRETALSLRVGPGQDYAGARSGPLAVRMRRARKVPT